MPLRRAGTVQSAVSGTVPALRCTVKRRCTASGTHEVQTHALLRSFGIASASIAGASGGDGSASGFLGAWS